MASSYQRIRKALDEARAQNASDADIIDALVQIAKSSPESMAALKAAYHEAVKSNCTDLSSAIERSLFNRQNTFADPRMDALVSKALSGEPTQKSDGPDLGAAIGAALAADPNAHPNLRARR
jgi:hypothetical protein